MDKFNSALRGYDKDEVNSFIDDIITRVETMVEEIAEKDKQINEYKKLLQEKDYLISEMSKKIENSGEDLTKVFTFDDMNQKDEVDSKKLVDEARIKSKKIIETAEQEADLIINECLMQAKKSEMRLNNLEYEIAVLKQKKETLDHR